MGKSKSKTDPDGIPRKLQSGAELPPRSKRKNKFAALVGISDNRGPYFERQKRRIWLEEEKANGNEK